LGLHARLVLTVHDELCYECPIDEVEQVCQIMKDVMEHPSPIITVPLKVDIKVCSSWEEGKGEKLPDGQPPRVATKV
jgi:DNA polymerase-1